MSRDYWVSRTCSWKRMIICFSVLLTFIYALPVATEVELKRFRKIDLPYYSAPSIGDAWLATTLISCIKQCLIVYTSCYSVTYNTISEECTPRSQITYYQPGTTRAPDDAFYYTNFCDEKLGFDVYLQQDLIQCLFVSTELAFFSKANQICSDKSASLYVVDSSNKLELLRYITQHVTRRLTWIGLTDQEREGTFVWVNGQLATDASFPVPWRPGQPDNAGGNEGCGEMGLWDYLYINDQYCDEWGNFICEMETS